MSNKTTITAQSAQKTVRVLSEGIKYDATESNRKRLEKLLEDLIRNSVYLSEEKKEAYIRPLHFLQDAILLQFKDVFIRLNLKALRELVSKKVIEKQMIERLHYIAST